MEGIAPTIALAVAVFAGTNVDDMFVLIAFLAQPAARVVRVFAGQYLGIGSLYAASVACSYVSLAIAPSYVGLLGLVPIAIGACKLWDRRHGDMNDAEEPLRGRFSVGQALAVAFVTIANGGDNVAIYTPLFAVGSAGEVALFGAVFAVMTTFWCLAAYWMVSHRTAGALLRRHAQRIIPFALILLGLFVLYEAGTYRLVET